MPPKQFFTYRLFRNRQIVRVGKGSVTLRAGGAVRAYLEGRYPRFRWQDFDLAWHRSESAALKAEGALIEDYRRRRGELPPLNAQRGGGGGQVYVRCKARLLHGARCRNLAIRGNYGFCRLHR